MKIISVHSFYRDVLEAQNGEIKYICPVDELDTSRIGARQVMLLLDYAAYFNLEYRNDLITKHLNSLHLTPSQICSPYEAIGAYLKNQSPAPNGEIQVIDVGGDGLRCFIIRFKEGRYTLSREVKEDKPIDICPLLETYLQRSPKQIAAFEAFLQTPDSEGKPYGRTVWECIQEYEQGSRNFDAIVAAFDNEDWADITLTNLVSLKKHLQQLAKLDPAMPTAMVGLLSSIFSSAWCPRHPKAAPYGAHWLHDHGDQFYAHCSAPIFIEIYCYPDTIKVPVYKANSTHNEYTLPKQIKLLNYGDVTLYRESRPMKVPVGNKEGEWVEIQMYLDGNQNLLVNTMLKSYLL